MTPFDCKTAQELRDHYKELKARTESWRLPPVTAKQPAMAVLPAFDFSTCAPAKEKLAPPERARVRASMAKIIATVAKASGVPAKYLLGKSVRRHLFVPRNILALTAYQYSGQSYPVIGDELGGLDAWTVGRRAQRGKKLLENGDPLHNEIYARTVASLEGL